MLQKLLTLSLLPLALLTAQPPPAQDAAPPTLPTAGSEAARDLVDQAFAKMLAYGRGMFSTREDHDHAFARQAGIQIGMGAPELSGGWHRDLVFGKWGERTFVRGNGRIASKVADHWHVSTDRLAGGSKLPFTVDPHLLFTVLAQLPAEQRRVAHVEAGKVKDRDVVVLTLQLSGEHANDFDDHSVVPGASGGFGEMIVFGGAAGGEPPRADLTTYIACFVDAQNGDLLRLAVRTSSSGGMGAMGGFQINAVAQVVGGNGDDDQEEEEKPAAKDEAPEPDAGGWKGGFPAGKPANDESVMTYRIDFTKLGLADVPAIDDAVKPLVGAR